MYDFLPPITPLLVCSVLLIGSGWHRSSRDRFEVKDEGLLIVETSAETHESMCVHVGGWK